MFTNFEDALQKLFDSREKNIIPMKKFLRLM